jgi:hypothetical protein
MRALGPEDPPGEALRAELLPIACLLARFPAWEAVDNAPTWGRNDCTTVAIALEFIDLVVPIARIREVYPGGWEQCKLDYAPLLGRRVWYDQHLFRDGAMGPSEARMLVEGWAVLGFEPTGTRRDGLYWKDLCVVEWNHGGPTRPCEWLSFDKARRIAHLAGTEPGPLVWRGQPSPRAKR